MVVSTSGTYNLSGLDNFGLIKTAYSMSGKDPALLVLADVLYAKNITSAFLLHWTNRVLNLWTVKQTLLTIEEGVGQYNLSGEQIDILEASLRTSTRALGGTATALQGTASLAFDGDVLTKCTQTNPNGWIQYDYGAGVQQSIQMLGVVSGTTRQYTFALEGSNDGVKYYFCGTYDKQTYEQYKLKWLPVSNQDSYRYFRLSETGGAVLDISEVYLNNNCVDTILTAQSRSQYQLLSNKYNQARPSMYYLDRQLNPIVLNVYPYPTVGFNCIVYNSKNAIQDFGDLTDSPQIPARFYLSLITELSYWVSMRETKPAPEVLAARAEKIFSQAASSDIENNIVPTVSFNY